MAWFCKGCGERRGGPMCKKWCHEKYGNMGAERIPPLDGMIYINDDGSGIPRWEQRRIDDMMCRRGHSPKSVRGPRPNGWVEALERIGERAAKILAAGLSEQVFTEGNATNGPETRLP